MKKFAVWIAGILSAALVGGYAQLRQQVSSNKTKPPVGFTKMVVLWPGGAPGAVGKDEEDIPKLYVYPAVGEGVHSAVIVMPGGGYRSLVTEKEGGVPARWLAAHGVTAFVLEYRLGPRYHFPAPMLDGARAVRYVRSHAEELGVAADKIGVWGFSAGGHLAGYMASVNDKGDARAPDAIERVSDRPDFAIVSYGRLSMDDAIPRTSSLDGLLGDHPTAEQVRAMSIEQLVTKDTAPSFVYSTSADQTVDSRNATAYYDAMKRAGAPVELHIFEHGRHGTGMGVDAKGQPLSGLGELAIVPTLIANWMQMHGWMSEAK